MVLERVTRRNDRDRENEYDRGIGARPSGNVIT